MKMVMDVYSHILDEDRSMNAQRFEDEFYSGKDESNHSDVEEPAPAKSDLETLMALLQKSELAALVKALIGNT